ncbi:hypothetical protein HETIRDRAFT_99155 [Heterobasidion irregulare TC 32-1]|uniref:Uncharacterized protein n=1 Tax=Heterobasidion irregulare (strain TC 32-1) TaxID=747525 RepID=W4KLV9_HETIT|nr:uncharacterized protein HETIRDRAFT_99155 [Heterobasidion irregulare TC 32-1]ETW86704.1 hypothetical protein HETIRDRAFT_99155 [Heterobasidion irregulare TC 32-1]
METLNEETCRYGGTDARTEERKNNDVHPIFHPAQYSPSRISDEGVGGGGADARSVHFPTLLSLSGTTPWDACPAKRWERTRCTQAKPVLTSWRDMKRKSNRPVQQGLFATKREVNEANRSIHYLRAVANVGALSVSTCEHTGLDESPAKGLSPIYVNRDNAPTGLFNDPSLSDRSEYARRISTNLVLAITSSALKEGNVRGTGAGLHDARLVLDPKTHTGIQEHAYTLTLALNRT